MPSTPLRELILDDFDSALTAIVAGSDYFKTVADVRRSVPSLADIPNDYTLFVYSPSDQTVSSEGRGSSTGITEVDMLVNVTAIVTREVASDTAANEIAHDIEKAICADRQRRTYALNTKPIGREIITDESIEPWAFLTMRFVVRYRHDFANPSQQR